MSALVKNLYLLFFFLLILSSLTSAHTPARTHLSFRAALGKSPSSPFTDAGMLQSGCQGTLGTPACTLPQKPVGWGDRNTAPAAKLYFCVSWLLTSVFVLLVIPFPLKKNHNGHFLHHYPSMSLSQYLSLLLSQIKHNRMGMTRFLCIDFPTHISSCRLRSHYTYR